MGWRASAMPGRRSGRPVALWWRDDDAVADTPALRRLLEIATVPLALAVIPARLEPSLALLLQESANRQRAAARLRPHQPRGRRGQEIGISRDPPLAGDRERPAGGPRAVDGSVRRTLRAGPDPALEPDRCRPRGAVEGLEVSRVNDLFGAKAGKSPGLDPGQHPCRRDRLAWHARLSRARGRRWNC